MTIDRSLVEYLEKLGRIHLSEEERSASEKDLQSILSYIDTLNELDTDEVEPASHSFPVANVMRDDTVTNGADTENILKMLRKVATVAFLSFIKRLSEVNYEYLRNDGS